MLLRVLEVVEPEDRIVPRIEEIARPLAALHNHAPGRQPVDVLGQDELHLLGRHVAVRLDDGLGGHDGDVAEHQGPQALDGGDVRLERERRVHDDAVLVEDPERRAVRECREGVAEGGDAGPAGGYGADGVVGGGFDEEAVSCGERASERASQSVSQSVILRNAPPPFLFPPRRTGGPASPYRVLLRSSSGSR